MKNTILLFNGASSSGKSTTARKLQAILPNEFLHVQADAFMQMLPPSLSAPCIRELRHDLANTLMHTFHDTVKILADSGHNIIVDHVVGEDKAWIDHLYSTLGNFRVFSIGFFCDLTELLRRENSRSDRISFPHVTERQFHTIHDTMKYDLQIDTSMLSPAECAEQILNFLKSSPHPVSTEGIRKRHYTLSQNCSAQWNKGLIHIYTGDGKGKTTAAIGLAARAHGAGKRIFIGQFIKENESSEIRLLKCNFPDIAIESFGNGRFICDKPSMHDRTSALAGINRLQTILSSCEYDMVIADEANCALSAGLFEPQDLLKLCDCKPTHVELVFTGRNAHALLQERADLITEMRKVKHPYDRGIQARAGIEF